MTTGEVSTLQTELYDLGAQAACATHGMGSKAHIRSPGSNPFSQRVVRALPKCESPGMARQLSLGGTVAEVVRIPHPHYLK